jgi:hypothetical protein
MSPFSRAIASTAQRTIACALFFLALCAAGGWADNSVPTLQVRLIRATNDAPETSDPKVRLLNAQLKADFGYSCYQQVFFVQLEFNRDEKAIFELPEDFDIVITYMGRKRGQREFFVETSYHGKKFLGFYASFPEPAKPVLIRGPGTRDCRYIIALSPA